jgi:hypothetical protein
VIDDYSNVYHAVATTIGSIECICTAIKILTQQLAVHVGGSSSSAAESGVSGEQWASIMSMLFRLIQPPSPQLDGAPSTCDSTNDHLQAHQSRSVVARSFRTEMQTALSAVLLGTTKRAADPSCTIEENRTRLQIAALEALCCLLPNVEQIFGGDQQLSMASISKSLPPQHHAPPTIDCPSVWIRVAQYFAACLSSELQVGAPASAVLHYLELLTISCDAHNDDIQHHSRPQRCAALKHVCATIKECLRTYSIKHTSVIRSFVRFLLRNSRLTCTSKLLTSCLAGPNQQAIAEQSALHVCIDRAAWRR